MNNKVWFRLLYCSCYQYCDYQHYCHHHYHYRHSYFSPVFHFCFLFANLYISFLTADRVVITNFLSLPLKLRGSNLDANVPYLVAKNLKTLVGERGRDEVLGQNEKNKCLNKKKNGKLCFCFSLFPFAIFMPVLQSSLYLSSLEQRL